jgi:hypothetical protein
MESTNSTSEDDEVIYDLTSEARARSTPIERPCSRSIGTVYRLGQEVPKPSLSMKILSINNFTIKLLCEMYFYRVPIKK